jgi:GNAT superfamily N-acetyltransferase
MQSVKLKHEGLEIKFHETTNEHAKEYGFNASKPIFFKHLLVDVNKRNRGNGKALLNMVQEYAEKNNFDLIFGHIPNDAKFTKDSRISFFSDIEMVMQLIRTTMIFIKSLNTKAVKILWWNWV